MAVRITTEVIDLERCIRQELFCTAGLDDGTAKLNEVDTTIRFGGVDVYVTRYPWTDNAVVDTKNDQVVLGMSATTSQHHTRICWIGSTCGQSTIAANAKIVSDVRKISRCLDLGQFVDVQKPDSAIRNVAPTRGCWKRVHLLVMLTTFIDEPGADWNEWKSGIEPLVGQYVTGTRIEVAAREATQSRRRH